MAGEQNMPSKMRQEIDEIPMAAQRLIDGSKAAIALIGERLRLADPVFIATIARGSSDHAAAFLKYAIELETGLPVASIGPSIASVYGRQMKMAESATFAISQSGKSPDIVAMSANARRGGSLTIALTNVIGSPLAEGSALALDMMAGPELSVAATKSFVNSAVAGLLILAEWTGNLALQKAVHGLPEALAKAVACNWSALFEALEGHSSLYILGRGPAWPVACEAALKFKETSGLHAEAYSAAEVLHGPVSIVGRNFPVLAFAARDQSEAQVIEVCDRLAGQGASVYVTSGRPTTARQLPFAITGFGLTDALVQIASFYGFVEMLSRKRGLDPDRPAHLKKVTETI